MPNQSNLAQSLESASYNTQKSDTPPDTALSLCGQSFMHAAIQSPIDGATQLINAIAQKDVVADPELFKAPTQAAFGTGAWYAETIGAGAGASLPFLLVECLTRGAGAEAMTGSAPAAKMALDGALYGLVLTPSTDANTSFVGQRLTAAGSSAITFGLMGLTSRGLMAAAETQLALPLANPAFALSAKGIGLRLSASAAGGAVGGAASAESNSILSGQGLATKEQIGQSIASFTVTGAALSGMHIGGEYTGAALEVARNRALLAPPKLDAADEAILEKVQKAHFQYFRENSDPLTGLTKDRSTEQSAASIAAVGFSLTAHGVAADHGWISRDEAANYTSRVLNTLWNTKQGPEPQGTSGDHGLFYHFIDPKTGTRAGQNEVSTIDTALLMAGVLYSKNYFKGDSAKEAEIRDVADKLYNRVDWKWATNDSGRLSMGWTPENGPLPYDWQAYNEAQILHILALGSPTHGLPSSAWDTYMSTAKSSNQYGHTSLEFGPLFAHQYTQVWLDMRGRVDATAKKLGFDYFQNSRQATLAQHQYAIANPQKWNGYGHLDWGLTASDGPGDLTKEVDGTNRQFFSYNARGFPNAPDDGTIAPTAAAASLPFAPEIVMPTIKHWLSDRPEIFGPVGFADAFNPTFDTSKASGWVDTDSLGIDQGPILLMAENYRKQSIWQVMKNDPYVQAGMNSAGFSRPPEHAPGVVRLSQLFTLCAQAFQ